MQATSRLERHTDLVPGYFRSPRYRVQPSTSFCAQASTCSVVVDLPPIDTAKGIVGSVGAVVDAVGEGTLTPEEGQTVASILDTPRRAIET
jgi:hypothetical protein